jgi:hypothetical protein
MKQTFLKAYESPKAEVIEIESQGVLCASGITIQGHLQFNSNNGSEGGSWD